MPGIGFTHHRDNHLTTFLKTTITSFKTRFRVYILVLYIFITKLRGARCARIRENPATPRDQRHRVLAIIALAPPRAPTLRKVYAIVMRFRRGLSTLPGTAVPGVGDELLLSVYNIRRSLCGFSVYIDAREGFLASFSHLNVSRVARRCFSVRIDVHFRNQMEDGPLART